jgi:hypothetical protein
MLPQLLLLSFLTIVFSLEPSCNSCKFYIPHKTNPDFSLCNMFKNNVYLNNKSTLVSNLASHCRSNENLCGKEGFLYEKIDINEKSSIIDKEISDEYEELKNRCCGEVNETEEIEQLERDFFEVFQKIKKHNKQRIYKTTKDLYKLFKRD